MASREALVLCARKEAHMLLAAVLAWSRCMRDSGPTPSYSGPYQVAPSIVYVRSIVQISVRRNKYVSRLDKLRSEDGEVYYRGVKIGSLRCRKCVSESMAKNGPVLRDDNSGFLI